MGNKRLILFNVFLILFVVSLTNYFVSASEQVEKRLNYNEGFLYYLKSGNLKLTDDEYLAYCKDFKTDIYNKYQDDEFEWHDQFINIKKDLDDQIANYDASRNSFKIVTNTEFDKYDFSKNGFPCKPLKLTTYFHFSPTHYESKEIKLFFINTDDFNFFPYSQGDAKAFTERRKDRYGTIDRSVVVAIHVNLVPTNSVEYNKLVNKISVDPSESYILVGKINTIEVFENDSSLNAMGILVK